MPDDIPEKVCREFRQSSEPGEFRNGTGFPGQDLRKPHKICRSSAGEADSRKADTRTGASGIPCKLYGIVNNLPGKYLASGKSFPDPVLFEAEQKRSGRYRHRYFLFFSVSGRDCVLSGKLHIPDNVPNQRHPEQNPPNTEDIPGIAFDGVSEQIKILP